MKSIIRILIFLIASLIFIGCSKCSNTSQSDSQISNVVNSEESAKILSDLIELKDKMQDINIKDSVLMEMVNNKRNLIDTLIEKSINYKDNKVELIRIKKEMIVLKEDNKLFFNRINKLTSQNRELKILNDSIKNELIEGVKEKKILSNKLNRINNKASEIKISGVTIKAYTKTNPLFKKSKKVETTQANKTQIIEVSYIIPENSLAVNKEISIKTTLFSRESKKGIDKFSSVLYSGSEISGIIIFDEKIEYASGSHEVKISLDGKVLYSGEINLK